MTHQLRVLVAFSEDQVHNHNSNFRGSDTFFWLLWALNTDVMYTYKSKNDFWIAFYCACMCLDRNWEIQIEVRGQFVGVGSLLQDWQAPLFTELSCQPAQPLFFEMGSLMEELLTGWTRLPGWSLQDLSVSFPLLTLCVVAQAPNSGVPVLSSPFYLWFFVHQWPLLVTVNITVCGLSRFLVYFPKLLYASEGVVLQVLWKSGEQEQHWDLRLVPVL